MAHLTQVVSLSLAADGKTLVSADQGGTVKAWSLQSDRPAKEWKIEHPIHWVEMAADGRHFAVGTSPASSTSSASPARPSNLKSTRLRLSTLIKNALLYV